MEQIKPFKGELVAEFNLGNGTQVQETKDGYVILNLESWVFLTREQMSKLRAFLLLEEKGEYDW